MEQKNTLNEEQTKVLTVWALTMSAFTLDSLTGQVQKLRNYTSDSVIDARALIQDWKRQGKVKFVHGYWKWQF